MSRILNDVKRSLHVQPKAPEPAPVDTSGLGDAIAQVIRAQVAEQVKEAVKQAPAVAEHRQPFTDKPLSSTFPPPPPMAKPPMPIITMSRGADGRIRSASVGAMTFTVERDGAGHAMRLVPQE